MPDIFFTVVLLEILDDKIKIRIPENEIFTRNFLNNLLINNQNQNNPMIDSETFFIKITKKIGYINDRLVPLDDLLYKTIKIFIKINKYKFKKRDWIYGWNIKALKIMI